MNRRAAEGRLDGLDMAEYFRDVAGQDVLCLSITSSGSFRQALRYCSNGPHAFSCWLSADLPTKSGSQERIINQEGSITSIQVIYVPADDY